MNSNPTYSPRIAVLSRVIGLLIAALTVVAAAHFVSSWLAPVVAVPLLVAGWLVGFGLVVFLPFAIVAAGAWVAAR